jgi:hypothetical protein
MGACFVKQRHALGGSKMFRVVTKVIVLLRLAACSTPYKSSGIGGGYEDAPLGGGKHSISVRGNSYTSHIQLETHFARRAGELCPSGFTIIDKNHDTVSWGRLGNKPVVGGTVQCN